MVCTDVVAWCRENSQSSQRLVGRMRDDSEVKHGKF